MKYVIKKPGLIAGLDKGQGQWFQRTTVQSFDGWLEARKGDWTRGRHQTWSCQGEGSEHKRQTGKMGDFP